MTHRTNKYSPVVVFTYNKYKETMQTMETLSKNTDALKTDVYVFSNAALQDVPGDMEKVNSIREELPRFSSFFHKYEIIFRNKNEGPNKNMLDGIDRIVNQYGRVIVLEDDIITAPAFLSFMNQALDEFAFDKRVFSICGYNPVSRECALAGDSFSYDVFRSWGWGIWEDRWNLFSWSEYNVDKINACRVHSECPLYVTAYREDLIYPKGTYERFLDMKLFYMQAATNKTVIYA